MNVKNELNVSSQSQSIDLKKSFKVIANSKKILLFSVIAFLILGLLYIIRSPAIYAPTALIQVNNQSSSSSFAMSASASAVTAPLGLSGGGEATQDEIEMALMRSSYILQPVIQKLNLDVTIRPKYFPFIGSYVAGHYMGEGIAPAKLGLSSFAWGGESWSLGYFLVPIAQYNKEYRVVMQANQHYELFDPNGKLILNGRVGSPASSNNKKGTVQILWKGLNLRPGTVLYIKKL